MSDLKYNLAFIRLMDIEGGEVNDPDDPGGRTKFGISSRYHPEVDLDSLTLEKANEFYRREYWDKNNIDLIDNHEIAQRVFIFCVNPGGKKAIVNLQKAATILGASLSIDGILGPKTAAWVNKYRHQLSLLAAFRCLCNKWYIDHAKAKYIAGWLARLE